MKITNVRMGFATNSSSSHSIVFFPDGEKDWSGGGSSDAYEFGWESFCLDDAESKLRYLAVATAKTLLTNGFSDNMAMVVLRDLFAATPISNDVFDAVKGYIDHQSAFNVAHFGLSDLERNVREYIDVFSDPRIVVYGGNDNSDDTTYAGAKGKSFDLGSDHSAAARVRKDGEAIVVFNRFNGAKVRLASGAYEKASVPELVDVKITDFCPYGCQFCYQGSTKKGQPAESYRINALFEALGAMGVFEVAMGGGEPTTHSGFSYAVQAARRAGIVPNFTTFAVDWLLDDEKVAAASLCGGIGVSVHTERDYAKVKKIAARLPNVQVMAQHVFGTMPAMETWSMLGSARSDRIPVLLLGFKQVGFGTNYLVEDMKQFDTYFSKDYLKDLPRLSVDTAFVNQHENLLSRLGVNPALVSPREGAFSMYIDAVKWEMGPSSYCLAEQMIPMSSKYGADIGKDIKTAFAAF